MATQGNKTTAINLNIKAFTNLPVIKDYYLILGGGKIGTDFLQYARKNGFPFVLIIDRDENAPAAREARILKNRRELINILREKATEQLSGPEIYFYAMDMHSVPSLLRLGIPENIIPAVPCHAVAYMLADILEFPVQEAGTEESPKAGLHETAIPEESPEKKSSEENSPVDELFIRPEDTELLGFFKTLAAVIPEDVIAGSYPEYGMLFFSYAKEGEICPDSCPGPRDRCPTFGRNKPKTITEYTEELKNTIPGWVFESHQMKPGIGGLKGKEFKRNILEILAFVRTLQEERSLKKPEKPEERAFFIATTCTCHGVLNLFYVT